METNTSCLTGGPASQRFGRSTEHPPDHHHHHHHHHHHPHIKLPGKCQVWCYFLTLIRNHIRTTSSNPPNLRSNGHEVSKWNLWRCLSSRERAHIPPLEKENHHLQKCFPWKADLWSLFLVSGIFLTQKIHRKKIHQWEKFQSLHPVMKKMSSKIQSWSLTKKSGKINPSAAASPTKIIQDPSKQIYPI